MSTTNTSNTALPAPRDVLCSRGKTFPGNEGNARFLLLVRTNQYRYQKALRYEKSRIVRTILSEILSRGGRFLKASGGDGTDDPVSWTVLDDLTAKRKIGHALRDANRPRTRKASTKTTKRSRTGLLSTQTLRALHTLMNDVKEDVGGKTNERSRLEPDQQPSKTPETTPSQAHRRESTIFLLADEFPEEGIDFAADSFFGWILDENDEKVTTQ